ncbi:levansucrase [Poseidonocella sp. HB161398]|uniref:levansucrase n=1 Tax=Poseidonocella sp. HB161398 TaxID=2320855 RepID=UPI001108984C|nr:levansucrase [Poseidonocella sp. HB161398]
MALTLKDKWIWDSWYLHDGGRWHAWFLEADRALGDPELRHFNARQGHAVSDDLQSWTYLGTSLAPRAEGFDSQATWTGSVVTGPDGLHHLFYTGCDRAEGGLWQRIGHAVSRDLHDWERVGDGPCLDLVGPAAVHYEAGHAVGHWPDRAMRDPWVMPDPEGDGWLMYFTARVPGRAEANDAGAIGFATSPDLHSWELQPPVFAGGFGQLEVPQVFRLGGRWHCLFCTAARHWSDAYRRQAPQPPVTGSHYLVAEHPRGPWQIAPGPFLDGAEPCRRYAARMVETGAGPMLTGFADGGRDAFGGYLMDPAPLGVAPDGRLVLVPQS